MLIIFICWANVTNAATSATPESATLRVFNSTGHDLDNITVKIKWRLSGYSEYYKNSDGDWTRDKLPDQKLNTDHTFSGTLKNEAYSKQISIGKVLDPTRFGTEYTCWFVEYSYNGAIYQSDLDLTSPDCFNAVAYGYFSFSLKSTVGNVDIKITEESGDMKVQVLTGNRSEDNSFKYSVKEVRKI